jgi:hypothetical protein
MIGQRKPFNKSLHAKNDPRSRQVVKKFFAERGVTLVDHPDKYDIDLQTEDGKLRVEVEHRLSWTESEFNFDDVNVLERKAKFFLPGNTHYCILSKDYSHLGFISAENIQKYMKPEFLKESSNRFLVSDEYFYKIPKTEFEWYRV